MMSKKLTQNILIKLKKKDRCKLFNDVESEFTKNMQEKNYSHSNYTNL